MSELDWQTIIKQFGLSGAPDLSKIGDILNQCGVSPDDPQAASSLLEHLGVKEEELNKERIIDLINRMTAGIGSEGRRQLGGLIEAAVRQFDGAQLPEDVADFLKQWQGR